MKMPFRCPICNGTGRVPRGFYDAIGLDCWTTSDATPETCRSCEGTGIVYVEQDNAFEMKIDMREDKADDFKFY